MRTWKGNFFFAPSTQSLVGNLILTVINKDPKTYAHKSAENY